MAVTRCRAKVVDDCEDGCTTTKEALREDSTWDGKAVVCNACYIEIEPLMRMNAPGGVLLESNAAVERYREAIRHIREHAAPSELIADATMAANESRVGSPRYHSAMFLARLARREIERRK